MNKFVSIFKKYPVVIAAYLFGSRASKQIGRLSDYDFAIQVSENTPKSKYLDIKLKLAVDLVHAVRNNAVDVVILNEASLLLKFEVLRQGKLIYDRNPAKRASLIFETLVKYLDWNYFEKKFTRSIIKRTASKGLSV